MEIWGWVSGSVEWLKTLVFGVSDQVIALPVYWAAPLMILVGAADSSLLSLPEVNDIITITRIAHNPAEVWFFPLFPALGSVLGCSLLYYLARQGRDTITKRFHPEAIKRVELIYRRWGFLSLAIPALLPPPLPFKIFVATAGALGYPPKRFAAVVMIARTIRYYFWGFAAWVYREEVLQALKWLEAHFELILGAVVGGIVFFFLIRWLLMVMKSRALRAEASYSD
ncbi:MAG: VTT domain-containing protein [Acidobacteria bacterium]|nr:VTT domain-containing protein [Acidobacteriota bacterium]MBI3425385.1 VTT domain-containing protein [Acidobacteriota bacterium]